MTKRLSLRSVSLYPALAFSFLLTVSLGSCHHRSQEVQLFDHTFITSESIFYDSITIDDQVSFIFENKSPDTAVTLRFCDQKGVDLHSAASILSSILKDTMIDEQKALSIWRFVSISGYHHNYDYDHYLQDHVDPISLVTFPYFMCGEKAGIIVNLASISGFPAHSVGLDGHVVAEIKYNGTWHMFDADENCIFRNADMTILSVDDLHNHPGLVSEKNIEYSLKDNFQGFSHYRDYISHYQPSWIDTTSHIANYTFPTDDITLYPGDQVRFTLSPTSWWYRLRSKRGLLATNGVLKRKLNIHQKNTVTSDGNSFVLNEAFPYYITDLKLSSTAPVNSKVYFQYKDRITHQMWKQYIGTLTGSNILSKKFGAPVKPDIYYSYSIVFENLSADDAGKIVIEHEFEFNSLTFPLHHGGGKIVTLDTLGSKSLLYRIIKS